MRYEPAIYVCKETAANGLLLKELAGPKFNRELGEFEILTDR